MATKKTATPTPAEINRKNLEFWEQQQEAEQTKQRNWIDTVGNLIGDSQNHKLAPELALPYPKFAEPGKSALMSYREHGSGAFLLMAYLERRAADRTDDNARRERLILKMGKGLMTPDQFVAASADILRIDILGELDSIVGDLLTVFRRNYPSKDDRLVDLAAALRIGKGKSHYDAKLIERRTEAECRWVMAYLEMAKSKVYRSQNDISNQIANALGISRRAAINYWNDLTIREPWQREWADKIKDMVKRKGAANVEKSPAAKGVHKKRNFAFGKGCAN